MTQIQISCMKICTEHRISDSSTIKTILSHCTILTTGTYLFHTWRHNPFIFLLCACSVPMQSCTRLKEEKNSSNVGTAFTQSLKLKKVSCNYAAPLQQNSFLTHRIASAKTDADIQDFTIKFQTKSAMCHMYSTLGGLIYLKALVHIKGFMLDLL